MIIFMHTICMLCRCGEGVVLAMVALKHMLRTEMAQLYGRPQFMKVPVQVAQRSDRMRASGRLRAARCPQLPHEV